MHIQPAAQNKNSDVNFGVNFINKPKWNKELLKTLENSELVKNIDKKYPDAFIKYLKHDVTNMDLANDEPNFLASLVFGLDKDHVTAYNINSHTSEGADRALKTYIMGVSLKNIEKRARQTDENLDYTISIKPIYNKKLNIFKNFISKIFG